MHDGIKIHNIMKEMKMLNINIMEISGTYWIGYDKVIIAGYKVNCSSNFNRLK